MSVHLTTGNAKICRHYSGFGFTQIIIVIIAIQLSSSAFGSIQSPFRQNMIPTCILNCAQCVKLYGVNFDGHSCAKTCSFVKRSSLTKKYYGGEEEDLLNARNDNGTKIGPYITTIAKRNGLERMKRFDCTDFETIGRFIRN